MRFLFYFKIWKLMAKNTILGWVTDRKVLTVFLVGKIIRYIFYFGFLYFLVKGTNGLLVYNQNQILFFTATFVLIDVTAQFFFRSVYSFRPLLISGDFDLVLVKPVNALFRVLMGGPDPVDFITLPPIILIVIWLGLKLNPNPIQIFYYLILIINSILISMAFHIAVLALGVITLEVDNLVMVYRDLASMGRFPINIYKDPLRSILTFIVPIGIMVTVPAKALMGFAGPGVVFLSIAFGIALLLLSFQFWKFALKKYTSASS